MCGRGDGFAGDFGGIRVGEVRLCAVGNAFEQPRRATLLERVPADVRHLERRRQTPAASGDDPEAGHTGILVAAFVEPLLAEADAEEQRAAAERVANSVAPLGS